MAHEKEDDIREELSNLWVALLHCDQVNDDSDFYESGGTSLAAVQFAAQIQEHLSAPINAIDIVRLRAFSKILDKVRHLLGG